jgi:glycosyltransferase involved in cell wall biosynthesis
MDNPPKFSVIIPARDEEYYLPKCIESINKSFRELGQLSYEIIVVINRSTDGTEDIARENGCIIAKDESKNLSQIRNSGAKFARGKILITVDADSTLSLGMMKAINEAMESGKYAGGGVLIYPERWSLGIFCSGILIGLLGLWFRATAGLFFFTREAFEAIGGFNEKLLSAEDIDFAKRLRKYALIRNLRYKNIFSAHIVTSCRKFDKFGDWYFFTRLFTMLRLLSGKNQKLADEIWYDFPRN